jgi:hypothetical protein
MVESALVLFLFLFVMIGIVDMGTILFTYQGLVQRVQAGARYGIVNSYDDEKIRNVVAYGDPEGGTNPFFGMNKELISVQSNELDNQISRVQVYIDNYPMHLFTPFVSGAFTLPRIGATFTTESEGATT